jgi:UDP-perosamine 4-acetyltransferase
MRPIVIVGAGGHGKVVADAVRAGDAFEVAAFADERALQRDGDMYLGAKVIAGEDALQRARALGIAYAIAAFDDGGARLGCCERLLAHGFELVSVVHPRAIVAADVSIGPGTFIGAGAVVGAAARLGQAVIVNAGAIVEHDCFVDNGVHVEWRACLLPRAHIGGTVTIGAGAIVGKGVRIGAHARIAAGAIVAADLPHRETP